MSYNDTKSIIISKADPKFLTQRGAFALIVIGESKDRKYLLQWNANWRMFSLIGGRMDNSKGDENSWFGTLRRELMEELGLCPTEFRIERELKQIQIRQFSLREQRIKNYHFCISAVEIFPNLSLNTVSGKPISVTTQYIFQ